MGLGPVGPGRLGTTIAVHAKASSFVGSQFSPSILSNSPQTHVDVTRLSEHLLYRHQRCLLTGAARLPVVWAVRRDEVLHSRVILLRGSRWGAARELGSSLRRVEQPRILQQVELVEKLGCSTRHQMSRYSGELGETGEFQQLLLCN